MTVSRVLCSSYVYSLFHSISIGSRAIVDCSGLPYLGRMNKMASSIILHVATTCIYLLHYAAYRKKNPRELNHYSFIGRLLAAGCAFLGKQYLTQYRFYPLQQTPSQIIRINLATIGYLIPFHFIKASITAIALKDRDISYLATHKIKLQIAINAISLFSALVVTMPLLPYYAPMLTIAEVVQLTFFDFCYVSLYEACLRVSFRLSIPSERKEDIN